MAAAVFALRIGDRMYYRALENGEKYTVGGHRKDTLHLDSWEKHQIEMQAYGGKLWLRTKAPLTYSSDSCPAGQLLTLGREQDCQLMCDVHPGRAAESIALPYRGIIRFGRSERCDVVLDMPFVSKLHFTLRMDGGNVRVEDNASTHGLYLNGNRIHAGVMRTGDALQIWTVRVVLENGKLFFENVSGGLRIGEIRGDTGERLEAVPAERQGAFLLYHRSPRMQEQLPREDIVLADPPAKTAAYERKRSMLLGLLGPGVMMAANIATMGAASPALLLARSAGLVTPLVSMASYGGMDKKQRKRLEEYEVLRRQRFGAYIEDQKRHIDEVAQHQRAIITRENPSPYECMKTVMDVRRNLWERAPSDRDFLDVRLGMGYEPLCVPVKSRAESCGFRMEDDEMEQVVRQIVEETRIVDNVPARLSLRKYQTVGVVGKRRHAVRLVQNLLVELACLHSPQNVRLVGIFDREEMDVWAPLRWLPHVWDDEGQFRYIAFDEKRSRTVCELLQETLKARQEAAKENSGKAADPQPYYIVLLGSKTLIRQEPVMQLLTKNDPALGVSTIFLFDDLYSLPQSCRCIVETDNDCCAYDRTDISQKFFFTPDEAPDEEQLDKFARQMSAIRAEEQSKAAGIPDSVTFLQGYGVRHPEELRVLERWCSSRPYESLAAPIGVGAGGKTFFFDIQDGRHGPHGLMAGTTGAGKSELLQSWILSMAVNYHPRDVIFVLIDYKGGGMANLLEPLPHVVGKITNLGSGIARALEALTAENKRRQALFAEYGVNDIRKYQKLYREGRAEEPLPYLIIVADEFAELKREQSDFMSGLISISRIGRSLGVRLVLATQQPNNVVSEEIDTNSRFRICLKMNSARDSQSILKHADAARITHPGRAYIRVGEDELFELFQSYWSGALYRSEDMPADTGENRVSIVSATGERVRVSRAKRERRIEEVDELTAVLRCICRTAEAENIRPLPGLWLPELPERVPLRQILPQSVFNGGTWGRGGDFLRIPIGMFDDPSRQRQGVQYLDLSSGHCAVYGAPMSGKTYLLKTFLLSMAMCCTPEDMQAYILDSGWSFSTFGELPHVGDVITNFEEEKREKLQAMLSGELERRKSLFMSRSVSSLAAYRDAGGTDLAAIVLVIDDILTIRESIDDPTNAKQGIFDKFLRRLAAEGASYGLYLIYTSSSSTGVSAQLTQYVKNVIALQMQEVNDYNGLVGVKKPLPPVKGRGFCRGDPTLEFQTALYLDYPTEPEQNQALEILALEMNNCWTGTRPRRVPMLAETVRVSDMAYTEPAMLPVGQNIKTLEPARVDLSQSGKLIVCGSHQTDASSYLAALCRLLLTREENRLYVVDSPSKAMADISSAAAAYCVSEDTAAVQKLLDKLAAELNDRLRRVWDGKSPTDSTKGAQICVIIDDLTAFANGITEEQTNRFEVICGKASEVGAAVLASATASHLEVNRNETITSILLTGRSGVAVDGSASMYSCFKVNIQDLQSQANAPGAKDGFLFANGTCCAIRCME